ncbi:MAG: fibronectin type III domain-containing protein [Planctomycetota bacterium]|jgi:hypothetical protein|nr:fibronectin type III domain-containing protein [Planctomycetota bacterium]
MLQLSLPGLLLWVGFIPGVSAEGDWIAPGHPEFVIRFAWETHKEAKGVSKFRLRNGKAVSAVIEFHPDKVRFIPSAGKAADVPVAGQKHRAWLQSKAGKFLLAIDGTRRISTPLDLGAKPSFRWEEAPSCKLIKIRVQPLSPIVFGDGFMRAAGTKPQWRTVEGRWAVQASMTPSQAANAFRFLGQGNPRAFAVSNLSYWFWSDYRFGVSLRSENPRSTAGLVFYRRDAQNYHLLRWREGKQLELCRVRDGKERVLAQSPLFRHGGTWYRLAVTVFGESICGWLDGTRVVAATDQSLLGGRIGLAAGQGEGCWFDDVKVESLAAQPGQFLPKPFGPGETDRPKFVDKKFTSDSMMRSWAHPRGQWEKRRDGLYWHSLPLFNDATFEYTSSRWPLRGGEIALFADRKQPGSGYRVSWDFKRLVLRRNGKELAERKLKNEGIRTVRFSAVDGAIRVDYGAEQAIRFADPSPLIRGEAGAWLTPASSWYLRNPDWRDSAILTSSHHTEYLFDGAPAAWEAQRGNWRASNRWSCVPMWSFFGGRSTDNVILWNKRRIRGDWLMELAFAPMEGTPQRVHFTFPITLNVSFCSDGRSLDSGYNLVFGTCDIPSRLYRRDRLVAETSERVIPQFRHEMPAFYRVHSRVWQRVRIHRKGRQITIKAEDFDREGRSLGMKLLLKFNDPQPLTGERFGVWTWGQNGMAMARASLSFEESPGIALPQTVKTEPGTKGALRTVNRASGGGFRTQLRDQTLDVIKEGLLRFRYRFTPDLQLGLFVRRRKELGQFVLTGKDSYRAGAIPMGRIQTEADEKWHEAEIDLRGALARMCPDDPARPIDEIFIESPLRTVEEIGGIGLNRIGAVCELSDVRFSSASAKPLPAKIPPPQIRVHGVSVFDDFESGLGGWQTFGGKDGALLWREPLPNQSGHALRLFNLLVGGPAGASLISAPFDARFFPILRFDYRFPPDLEINMVLRANNRWFEVRLTGIDQSWPLIGAISVRADNEWHSAELDLLSALQNRLSSRSPIWIDRLYLADTNRLSNPQGLTYYVDNFCLVPAVPASRKSEFQFVLAGDSVSGFSYSFDTDAKNEPPQKVSGQGNRLQIAAPKGASWLHVRAQTKDGKWSPVTHLPIRVRDLPAMVSRTGKKPNVDGPPSAPYVSYIPSDSLCFNDYDWENDPGGLGKSMGDSSIRRCAWMYPCSDDSATGEGCLEILNLNRNEFFSPFLHKSSYDLRRYPRVAFDYKFETSGCAFNLTGLLNKEMYVVEWLTHCGQGGYFHPYVAGRLPMAQQDRQWHRVDFDLQKMVVDSNREGDPILPLRAEQLNTWAMGGGRPMYDNPLGARFKIDNFTIYSARGRDAAFEWKVHNTGAAVKYTFKLDQTENTEPPNGQLSDATSFNVKDLKPGTYYFHVKARDAKERWSPTTHLKFEVEDSE